MVQNISAPNEPAFALPMGIARELTIPSVKNINFIYLIMRQKLYILY